MEVESFIKNVTYSLLTDEEKIKESVAEITKSNIFVEGDKPVRNGVYDTRLGTTGFHSCSTCYHDIDSCPGHFGHILLNYPVKVPFLIKDIMYWLNIVCHTCGYPVVNIDYLSSSDNKYKELKSMSQDYKGDCYKCGSIRNKVTASKNDNLIMIKIENGFEEKINNLEIKRIFNMIPPKLIKILDLSEKYHPKNFITSVIRISPVNVRPEIRQHTSTTSFSDDATKIYQMIISENNKLADDDDFIDQRRESLDNYYYHLVLGDPNSVQYKKVETSMKSQLSSYISKLKSKKGYIRQSTQGKKVEEVGRSVIVGETDLRPDTLIISLKTAKELYRKITVTMRNIDKMNFYLISEYPTIKTIIREGNNINARIFKKLNALRIGDIVHRDLIDGDLVLFNRMPSLHWSSVSAHKVQVVENEWAYRFNESSCIHFNADFDGDEMNIYVLNNTLSIVEMKYLCNVINWGISYQDGSCTIGLKEDAVLGIAHLTKSDVFLEYSYVKTLFNQTTINPDPAKFSRHKDYNGKVPVGKFSGRDVISILLTEMNCNINYKRSSNSYNEKYEKVFKFEDSDKVVVIRNGNLLSGIMDSSSSKQGKIGTPFHIVYNEFGSKIANELAYNMQQIGVAYLNRRGFSFGMEDILIAEKPVETIRNEIKIRINKSKQFHHKYVNGKLIPPINKTTQEYYEEEQISILSFGQDFHDKVLTSLESDNSYYSMGAIGSKGDIPSLVETISMMGQSKILGERLKKDCGGRATIYSTKESYDPEDRGYIPDSLIFGLNNKHIVGNSQAERIGIVFKSNETANSGYFTRLTQKSMESEVIDNRYCVIADNEVIQILYGGDGIDPRRQEFNHIPELFWSYEKLNALKVTFIDIKKIYHNDNIKKLLDNEFETMKSLRDKFRSILLNGEVGEPVKNVSTILNCPIDVERTIFNHKKDTKDSKGDNLDIKKTIDVVNEYIDKIKRVLTSYKGELPRYIISSFMKVELIIRIRFSLRTILDQGLNNDEVKNIMVSLYKSYMKSLISSGTPIGLIVGQSMGEPATQSVLNSIHNKDGGGGLEEIKDILQLKKINVDEKGGMSSPYSRFNVFCDANEMANSIEMKSFDHFILNIVALERKLKASDEYESLVKTFLKYNLTNVNVSNICFIITLNKMELIIKNISMDKIVKELYDYIPKTKIHKKNLDIEILYSFMKDEKLCILIYLVSVPEIPINELARNVIKHIEKCIIGGVRGIKSASVNNHTKSEIEDDGSLKKNTKDYIVTEGVNILELYNDPRTDKKSFKSNYILKMYEHFGIIAAEMAILSELKHITAGTALNVRHHLSIAAGMTYTGQPLANNYHGLKKRYRNNVSLQLGTENPTDALRNSLPMSKSHNMTGLSASLLYSSNVQYGTNFNELCMNESFVKNNKPVEDDIFADLKL
jgi:DNA-directed RNA polymerase II subunit RPB1